jgi:hypothetical protein
MQTVCTVDCMDTDGCNRERQSGRCMPDTGASPPFSAASAAAAAATRITVLTALLAGAARTCGVRIGGDATLATWRSALSAGLLLVFLWYTGASGSAELARVAGASCNC